MRILLAYAVPAAVQDAVLANNVDYRPDLERKDAGALASALVALRPDALVTRALPAPAALAEWESAVAPARPVVAESPASTPGAVRVWRVVDGRPVAALEKRFDANTLVHRVVPACDEHELAAFVAVEEVHRRMVAPPRPRVAPVNGARGTRSVVMVGAGIVNLVTALALVDEGYDVAVLERSPDPRSAAHWTKFGCTRGGGNARMYTLTECDNYNDKTSSGTCRDVFARPISECGWGACDRASLSPDERRWIEEHASIPPWLASVYNDDIFMFNRESRELWRSLMRDHAELFDDVELHPGILRLYTDPEHFEWSATRHARIGALAERLAPGAVADRYPALATPCRDGVFAGGLEVVGFTVDVHRVVARLVDRLEAAGVRFLWERPVDEIVVGDDGRVAGVRSFGDVVSARHYVVSAGAYGDRLLRAFRSHGRIHGVLGAWVTLPNVEPKLHNSLKIARRGHRAEDANVTVAKDAAGDDVLVYGSGYGHTGIDPRNVSPAELDCLFAAVEENARTFFPEAYERACEHGPLAVTHRYCVRPWTASGLGVFELVETTAGGVLALTGGHNTGGFAQSPSVAAAVVAALRGEWHPMHELYAPERASSFVARDAPSPAPLVAASSGIA